MMSSTLDLTAEEEETKARLLRSINREYDANPTIIKKFHEFCTTIATEPREEINSNRYQFCPFLARFKRYLDPEGYVRRGVGLSKTRCGG